MISSDHRQSGFSLIELMIVVAIVGVLAAIAIPSYQHYTSKAKFTEVMQASSPFKLAVESCVHEHGNMVLCVNGADGAGQSGIPPAVQNPDNLNTYVKSANVKSSGNNSVQIIVTSQHIGKNADVFTYILSGVMQDSGQIFWKKDLESTCIAAGIC
jgi:type IV pilus assembly protein PilA